GARIGSVGCEGAAVARVHTDAAAAAACAAGAVQARATAAPRRATGAVAAAVDVAFETIDDAVAATPPFARAPAIRRRAEVRRANARVAGTGEQLGRAAAEEQHRHCRACAHRRRACTQ